MESRWDSVLLKARPAVQSETGGSTRDRRFTARLAVQSETGSPKRDWRFNKMRPSHTMGCSGWATGTHRNVLVSKLCLEMHLGGELCFPGGGVCGWVRAPALGNRLHAKQSFARNCVPEPSSGTRSFCHPCRGLRSKMEPSKQLTLRGAFGWWWRERRDFSDAAVGL